MEVTTRQTATGRLAAAVRLWWIVVLVLLPAAGYAADPLLIVRAGGKQFDDFTKGMNDEIGDEVIITRMIIDSSTTSGMLAGSIRKNAPRLVVLLDNKAINLYRQYVKTLSDTARVLPSISAMGVYIGRAIAGIPHATGIAYEIPLVTSIVNLRSVLPDSLLKVGILHREATADFFRQDIDYCKNENIKVVLRPVRSRWFVGLGVDIRRALQELLDKENCDALWVPNDIAILQPDYIREIWVPLIAKYRKPVIVGVESLVAPSLHFGTFSVLPDHVSLGAQAAELVRAARLANWQVQGGRVENPVSIYKTINLRQAMMLVPREKINLNSVDKVLE